VRQAAVLASLLTPLLAALLAFGTYVVVQGAPPRLSLAWLGLLIALLGLGAAAGLVVLVATLL
jgi:hypothetical protein